MKAIIAFFLLTFVLGSFGQSQDSLVLSGTCYDFSNCGSGKPQQHPDFDCFGCGVTKGMVASQLGPDNTPVLVGNGKGCVTSVDTFNQWFHPVDGVNQEFKDITLTFYWDDSCECYKFRNDNFFPLDGQGYGNEKGYSHNYGFCFKLHTQFTYVVGQTFTFMGDDDVWVFINSQLVIDLGGVHGSAQDSINLDTLGLIAGKTYTLDFFFCERHYSESHLIISTSITLNPCGTDDTDSDGIPDLCDNCPKGDMGLDVWADDQIGPNNGVTVHAALTTTIVNGYDISVNWGDDDTWTDYPEVSSQLDLTHNYAETGEYTIQFKGAAEAGCGNPGPVESCTVTVGGKRLAPKCSEYSVVPGTGMSKRKRSL